MTAYIFTGGKLAVGSMDELGLHMSEADLIIAADSGYNNASRLGVRPGLLLGDLDSIDRKKLAPDELEHIEKIIVPAIKDDTDTQLAVDTAISRGADEIHIIGGLGGRLDHTLSSVFLLEYIADRGAGAVMTDGQSRVRVMKTAGEPVSLMIPKTFDGENGFKYLSVVPLTDECEGVRISGVFYPLDGVTLERRYSYAVSNEITSDSAEITLEKGTMLVIESRDLNL
ncbi:MAG: thiamine diphosphokinase [Eubacteriales bacterium]|nr:thiamine diphosphokinase [Eubacteriales bacterium]